MTGAEAPVIRAAVMTTIFLLAELAGRQKSAGPALVFAAAVMVAISPATLREVSFQLSFLSMAGLIYISPPLLGLSGRLADKWFQNRFIMLPFKTVLDSFCVTLAALLAIWPLLAYYFNIVSLVAPLATLLAVPSLTGIIVLSGISSFWGLLFFPLGQVFGWAVWLFLSYLLLVVNGFASIPGAAVNVRFQSPVLIIGYYLLLAVILWSIAHRKSLKKYWAAIKTFVTPYLAASRMRWIVIPLAIIAILTATVSVTLPDNRLHVYFLDVGQGDAVLIRHGSQEVLIDGGPSGQSLLKQLGTYMPFWDRNIEMVILTHPDADHITGLEEVAKRFSVEKVLYSNNYIETERYAQWKDSLAAGGAVFTEAETGQKIALAANVEITIFNPENPARFEKDSDDNCVVARLEVGKFSFLFTGDIYSAGENLLLNERAGVQSTVLKVAHHGSANSTSTGFLNAVMPAAAVISVGKDNAYGHPAPETLARLNDSSAHPELYRTDENGTVEFFTDGSRLWVKIER